MDVGALIALVFKNRPIWDRRYKEHRRGGRVKLVNKCWKEISEQMNEDEHILRKKWKYLRDQFPVEYRKRPRTKWPHFEDLLFLKDIVELKDSKGYLVDLKSEVHSSPRQSSPTLDPVSPAYEVEFIETHFDQSIEPNDSCDETDNNDMPQADRASSTGSLLCRKRKSEVDSFNNWETQKLKYVQENEVYRQKRLKHEDDEHLYFFKSLLPHVRLIPQHRLLSFRNRMQKIVEEFAYTSNVHQESS